MRLLWVEAKKKPAEDNLGRAVKKNHYQLVVNCVVYLKVWPVS